MNISLTHEEMNEAIKERLENQGFSMRDYDMAVKYVRRGTRGSGSYELTAEVTLTKKTPAEASATGLNEALVNVLDLGDD